MYDKLYLIFGVKWNDEEAKGKMVIKLDDGEEWIVEVRGGGWIKDCESGRKIRMKRLGVCVH